MAEAGFAAGLVAFLASFSLLKEIAEEKAAIRRAKSRAEFLEWCQETRKRT